MRTRKDSSPARPWLAGIVLLLAGEVLFLRTFEPLEPGNTVVHVLLYAARTLVAWIATGGRRPTLVVGGAMLLAATGPGLLVNALACIVTGASLLALTRNVPCAESSPR